MLAQLALWRGTVLSALREVEERLFQAHSGWCSQQALQAFITESLGLRLAPSAALGY